MPSLPETQPKTGTSEYNAEKQRKYRLRQKEKRVATVSSIASSVSDAGAAKIKRLLALLKEAQALSAEINGDIVRELRERPLDRETITLLNAFEEKEMRISFAKVDLPL